MYTDLWHTGYFIRIVNINIPFIRAGYWNSRTDTYWQCTEMIHDMYCRYNEKNFQLKLLLILWNILNKIVVCESCQMLAIMCSATLYSWLRKHISGVSKWLECITLPINRICYRNPLHEWYIKRALTDIFCQMERKTVVFNIWTIQQYNMLSYREPICCWIPVETSILIYRSSPTLYTV